MPMIHERLPGIYIHVPFCVAKCPYCNFYSVAAKEDAMDAYTQKICALLEEWAAIWPQKADSLYFGGGTPILLGEKRIDAIIKTARRFFSLENAEITLEANPASTLAQTLKGLWKAGVNRLSFGLQSAIPEELALLGRRHTAKEALLAVQHAREAGFSNISLDLMLGIPHQTLDSVEKSIAFCADAGVQHLSAYLLKIEPGTPFFKNQIGLSCPDEDAQAEIYLHAVRVLGEYGFAQYEISNFAKDGRYSHHNCKYWQGTEYLGLGPAAHSLLGGRRMFYPKNLDRFLACQNATELLVQDGGGGTADEYILLGLRLVQGIDKQEGALLYPDFDWDSLWDKAAPMIQAGYMRRQGDRLSFTPEGFLLSNSILARIL